MSQVTGPSGKNVDKFVINSIDITNKETNTIFDKTASPSAYNSSIAPEKFAKLTVLQKGEISFGLNVFDPTVSKEISNYTIDSIDF